MDDIEYQTPNGQGQYFGGGYGSSTSSIPPHVDKALGDGLGTISACGASNVTLIIALAIACALCFYLLKRNGSLVDQVLNLIPKASETVGNAVRNFEEKVDVLIKVLKKD